MTPRCPLRFSQPFAPLHETLIGLLFTEPKIFALPSPPLARTLRTAGLETFGGSVGIGGTPWNLARIRGLDRAEVVAGTMALGLLLAWIDDELRIACELCGKLHWQRPWLLTAIQSRSR